MPVINIHFKLNSDSQVIESWPSNSLEEEEEEEEEEEREREWVFRERVVDSSCSTICSAYFHPFRESKVSFLSQKTALFLSSSLFFLTRQAVPKCPWLTANQL